MLKRLLLYLLDRPTALLDEMAWFLYDEFDLAVDNWTIGRALKRANWTRKVIRRRALEANEERRQAWLNWCSDWPQHALVFIDESAAHERTGDRRYGWAERGLSPVEVSAFHRSPRWSLLPALCLNRSIEPLVYHGGITAEIFIAWLEVDVLPKCNAWVDGEYLENSIIIMDNCKIHKTPEVLQLLYDSGVRVEFLPAYSPDLNPIELDFATMKAAIRHNYTMAARFPEFGLFLQWIWRTYGGRHVQDQFRHCGYIVK